MPRPKTFDNEKVLTAAMHCFWRCGYTATSMKDLERATGLTPSSLYNSFDNKNRLFLSCVDHYIGNVVRKRIHLFLETGDPIDGIKQFVKDCFKNQTEISKIGCLLTNTSTELGPHDEVVREKVAQGMKLVEKALYKAVIRAQTNGQLSSEIDASQMAIHIGLLMNGMLVNAKVMDNRIWLQKAFESIDNLLHQLDQ